MSLPIIPKRSMGQNFLTSKRVVEKIVDAADPNKNDIILEIGPGLGAITEQLLSFAGKVVAIEKDNELVEILKEKIEAGKLGGGKERNDKQHKKGKKSFVIVTSDFDYNAVPDKLTVVPSLLEAHDIIEMEEIERDLGF